MQQINLREVKIALRTQIRAKAEALGELARAESDAALFARFLALPSLAHAQTVLLFLGQGIEPRTEQLCEALHARGLRVCLPRCLPERQMEARAVQNLSDLRISAFGIPEPDARAPLVPKDSIDLILVPALCCDRFGYRLGQGGGYYDRYLVDYKGESVTLCRAALLQERLPRGRFDRSISRLLTERENLSFPEPRVERGKSPARAFPRY